LLYFLLFTNITFVTDINSTPDEGLDLDYVPNKAKAKTVRAAISNNFGFGGHNACLVLKKYAK